MRRILATGNEVTGNRKALGSYKVNVGAEGKVVSGAARPQG